MTGTEQYDVIIVGAGIGGIISLKYARDAGLHALVLEKANQVGGIWRDLPAWQDIQIAKEDWALDGIPLAGVYQPDILRNIEDWVARFQLGNSIRLNCPVTRATADEQGWRVQTELGTLRAKHLIAATGAHNIPRIPDVERHASTLLEYHSSQLDDPALLTGKDVVVVGGGASAFDLLDLCFEHAARMVHWVFRSVRWMRPTSRPKYETSDLRVLARNQFRGATTQQVNASLNAFLRGRYKKYGLKEILPAKPLDLGQEQLVPGRRRMIENFSRIVRHRGTINRLEQRSVRLADGSRFDADILLWGTGYRMDLSYLDGDKLAGIDSPYLLGKRCGSVFRSLDYPNLFFLAPILDATTSATWAYAHACKSIMSHIRGGKPIFDETPTGEYLNHFDLVRFLAQRDTRNYLPLVWRLKYFVGLYLRKDNRPLFLP